MFNDSTSRRRLVILRKLIAWTILVMVIVIGFVFVKYLRDISDKPDPEIETQVIVLTQPEQKIPVEVGCEIWVLDVGNGLCVIASSKNEEGRAEALVFDGGDYDTADTVKKFLRSHNIGLIPSLWEMGKPAASDIKYMVCSHFDSDHAAGILKILQDTSFRLSKSTLFVPDYELPVEESNTKNNLLKEAGSRRVNLVTSPEGVYSIGMVEFQFMNIYENYEEENDYSLAIKITVKEADDKSATFFVGGDVCTEAEMNMVKSWGKDLKSDVLVASHHGSSSSNCKDFVNTVAPKYVITSCGDGSNPDKRYGHPTQKVLDTFAEANVNLYRTDKQGIIHLVYQDGAWVFDLEPTLDWSPGIR